ncbi:MAG: mandelate racemase/muconate lactonizing enzyme family protein, partial [Dehalococcoidia bacterium]
MKITGIDTFVVDAGWRPWQYIAVRTDEGITGYGECSDGRNPYGVVETAKEFEAILLGQDPRPVEARYWDMYRMGRQSPGGIVGKAIAGIDMALWDIKGKALGVPVYELAGGPMRERQRVYWSHCGSSRMGNAELIGVPPLNTWDDLTALGKEVVERGFTAL